MDTLFPIQSIALIGASANPAKLGHSILKNIITYGFNGHIYPINLNESNIENIRTYKDIADITDPIDLVVIAIPSQFVKSEVEKCVKKLVKYIIIISAGFKETGQDGALLEKQIYSIISHSNTKLIGPNCLGLIDAKQHINASFAANFPEYEALSFISQSGALGTAFLDWISANNLGIDTFISIGNKADIDENYLLEHLHNQKVIACYLEDIKDGKKLMKIGYQQNKLHPTLILKPGRSDAAVKAISSHTGSLAGGYKTIQTALKQSGYIEVQTISELFYAMKAFAWMPIPKDNNVAIITNAGGPAVITTDLLQDYNLSLAPLSQYTQDILAKALPRTANIHDPVDVIGDALADRYYAALDAVLREDNVSSVIVLLTPQIMTQINKTAEIIGQMKKYNKPIFASFIGGTLVDEGMKLLAKEKIPSFRFPEMAVQVLHHMMQHQSFLNKESFVLHTESKSALYNKNHDFVTESYMKHKDQQAFPPDISEQIAKQYSIPTPESISCATIEEAIYNASQMHYPVALKIASANLLHKSDIGGVKTAIYSEKQLTDAFTDLESIISNHQIKEAHIEMQPYITDGEYVIIGANRDQSFGTVLIVGQGGIYTEIMHDIASRIAPITKEEMKKMLDETTIAKILHGQRGHAAYNIDAIIQTIDSVQSLMIDYPFISAIDINPLIVSQEQSYAIDVKILL